MGARPPNATANSVFILFHQITRDSYFSINRPKNPSALFLESTHPAEAGKGSAMPTKKPTRRH
jgi:hypothetical protein